VECEQVMTVGEPCESDFALDFDLERRVLGKTLLFHHFDGLIAGLTLREILKPKHPDGSIRANRVR
jgi:hypothetical protein